MTEEEFDSVLAVHLKGSFNVSRAAAPHFKTQASGAYVHMTSTSGLIGNFGQANYSAAKLGIVGLSKSIALDMQRFNVRSNAVAPFAWTRMIELDPDQHARAAEARRGLEEARAGEDRAVRRSRWCCDAGAQVTGQIFGVRNNEIYPVLAAAPDPHRPLRRRLDGGDDRRARVPDVRERFLSAACAPAKCSPGTRSDHAVPPRSAARPCLSRGPAALHEARRYSVRAWARARSVPTDADDLPYLLEDRLRALPTFAVTLGSPGACGSARRSSASTTRSSCITSRPPSFTRRCRPKRRSSATRASLR